MFVFFATKTRTFNHRLNVDGARGVRRGRCVPARAIVVVPGAAALHTLFLLQIARGGGGGAQNGGSGQDQDHEHNEHERVLLYD